MGGPVYYEILYHVAEGMEEKHAEIIKGFVTTTDKEDPGTILYYFTEDPNEKNKWVLREVHKDDAAMMHHLGRVKDLLGDWLGTMKEGKFDAFNMVGDYSQTAKDAYAPFGVVFVQNGDGLGYTHSA